MSAAAPVATRRSHMAWYFLLLALASLMWSAQGTAVKFLDRQMGPIAITFVPFYVTTILLIPLLIRTRRRNPNAPRPTARDWVGFTIAGVGGQVLAQLGMTWGISKSLASNGAILNLLMAIINLTQYGFQRIIESCQASQRHFRKRSAISAMPTTA